MSPSSVFTKNRRRSISALTNDTNPYSKTLRDSNGVESQGVLPVTQNVADPPRVVKMDTLYTAIREKIVNLGFKEKYSVAQFALQMIAGVSEVNFKVNKPG